MSKKMLIDASHPEETRVVVVDGQKVEDFDFESENKRQLAGNIYLAKITRVEPSLQAAFVDYGGNRHGFLAFSEIHPDYYQIPIADREALLAEEQAQAEAEAAEEEERAKKPARGRGRSKAAKAREESTSTEPEGMETIEASDALDDYAAVAGDPDTGAPAEPLGEEGEAADPVEPEEDLPEAPIEPVAEKEVDEADSDAISEARPPRRKQPARRYKIQEVVKVRQIMLVQVVKEERGNKGAALTTYLSLAGRYCVLMPNTARGGGISRKITNAADRKKLKDVASEIEVPKGAGLIIRTAGAKRTKTEIKRDYDYLQRLWEQIRELTLKSVAPAKIYEEGDLIKRSIRDLYNKDIDEIVVDGQRGYDSAKEFMTMIMPSAAGSVKRHDSPVPLFTKAGIEGTLNAMFNPTIQLKSGGYIVIGVTEALVAIDVNSGRATKEGSIEETALKTNLEAAEEVARQCKLRDLAGLVVIDFIDMDERRNNSAVEKRLKDALKSDRARIQMGRISSFGLLEMSRQRMRPGMLEATTQPCPHCHGTGLLRSDDSSALQILRALEEEGAKRRAREVLLKAPVEVVNYLFNEKREAIAAIEQRFGMAVRLEGVADMVAPDFSIEKFKTQTRRVEAAAVVTGGAALMDDIDEAAVAEEAEAERDAEADAPDASEGEDGAPKKKKRRRRSRGGRGRSKNGEAAEGRTEDGEGLSEAARAEGNDAAEDAAGGANGPAEVPEGGEKPKKKRTRSRSRKKPAEVEATEAVADGPGTDESAGAPSAPEAEREAPAAEPTPAPEPVTEPEADVAPDAADAAPEDEPDNEPAPATPKEPETVGAEAEREAPKKTKKRGWWSLGR
ncbi:RNAse E [Hasllibacter halocynthiae]|uniref:Ribonuclease E n=1 Tax=Hasllibacter halocynthiae TaxID=595589 RepID=A0A2T0X7S8_9RHOB|nr:ribonuclease E/G [Hasllibacter halocynthiae]PRY94989.1 RNAse E [Hasllibacter halocynthiae]